MTVVRRDGGIGYEFMGTVYKSPSAAAQAAIGKPHAINGRVYWGIGDLE